MRRSVGGRRASEPLERSGRRTAMGEAGVSMERAAEEVINLLQYTVVDWREGCGERWEG